MTGRQYMLDTNMVSHMIRFPDGQVVQRVSAVDAKSLCISAVVASELRYGSRKRGSARLSALVEDILKRLDIAPYEDAATLHYAHVRNDLTRRGMPIGPVDLFIAAHALALDATLVTANVGEFSRVQGLKLENWIAEQETAP